MRKLLRALSLLCVLILFANCASAENASTEEKATATVHTVSGQLVMRRNPTEESKVLGHISDGSKVFLLDKAENGWQLISYKKTKAYVQSQYLIPDSDIENSYAKITAGIAFVRAMPDEKSDVIGRAIKKQVVTVVEKGKNWSKIIFHGEEGYVLSSALSDGASTITVRNKVASLTEDSAIRILPDQSSMICKELKAAQKVAVLWQCGDWCRVVYHDYGGYLPVDVFKNSGTDAVAGTDYPSYNGFALGALIAVPVQNVIHLFSQPGKYDSENYIKSIKAESSTFFNVYVQDVEIDGMAWMMIDTDDGIAWIDAQSVTIKDERVMSYYLTSVIPGDMGVGYVKDGGTKVLTEPSENAAVVASLPSGTEVFFDVGNLAYAEVEYSGHKGYIVKNDIVPTYIVSNDWIIGNITADLDKPEGN